MNHLYLVSRSITLAIGNSLSSPAAPFFFFFNWLSGNNLGFFIYLLFFKQEFTPSSLYQELPLRRYEN